MPRSNVVEKLALSMAVCPSLEGVPRAVREEVIEQTLRHLDLVLAGELSVSSAAAFYDEDAIWCDDCEVGLDLAYLVERGQAFVCRNREACAQRQQERAEGGLDG